MGLLCIAGVSCTLQRGGPLTDELADHRRGHCARSPEGPARWYGSLLTEADYLLSNATCRVIALRSQANCHTVGQPQTVFIP